MRSCSFAFCLARSGTTLSTMWSIGLVTRSELIAGKLAEQSLPAGFVAFESLRLEAARLMIEQSRLSLEVVAKEAGFRDRRHMREVFIRGYGVPPQAVRRDARRVAAD